VTRDGLPAHRWSPIQVVTGPGIEQLQSLIEIIVLTTTPRHHASTDAFNDIIIIIIIHKQHTSLICPDN